MPTRHLSNGIAAGGEQLVSMLQTGVANILYRGFACQSFAFTVELGTAQADHIGQRFDIESGVGVVALY